MEKLLKSSAKNIYIHIPFCKHKCDYCAFISFTNLPEYENLYVNSLIQEIQKFSSDKKIETIYFGGGTPNLLSLKSLEKIFYTLYDKFSVSNDAEITMEFNPKISEISYIKEVKSFGVNRISLGVQSFNDNILKTLNRIHNSQDTLNTIKAITNAGIDNYSVDLIYGIFGQTLKDIKLDLSLLKNFKPEHISTYGLKIEKGTQFEKRNKYDLPDEDTCADMYLYISKELESLGYNHYEISNFAQNNYESKHNLTYWKNQEYFGFGTAAHGFLNNIRYKNKETLEEYIRNPFDKVILKENNEQDNIEETIFLGLRLKEGIDLNALQHNFGIDLYKTKREKIDKYISNGYATLNDGHLALTTNGFLISNYILSELIS